MRDIKRIKEYVKDLHLLYVEDDKDVQVTAREMFSNFFTQITVAENGKEALDIFRKGSIDIIITDIAMPLMNGLDLITHIREEDSEIPIIVFSAWNDASYMSHCIKNNVDAYVLKPLDIKNLLDAFYKVSLKIKGAKDSFKEKFDIDPLTHLQSHSALVEQLDSLSKFEIPVMILLNIDDFHLYNEIYGLEYGDKILASFAQVLVDFKSSKSYTIYKISGDEFIFFEIVAMIDSEKYIDDIEDLFLYIDENPLNIEGIQEPIRLKATIGVAFSGENLYGRAAMALKEARRRGRKYLGFSAEVDRREELKHNLYCREEINRAIEDNRVHVYYQSIVDRDKNILKYEALIRIKRYDEDGRLQLVVPNDFIDFSKASRQYARLTQIVINDAFDTMDRENVSVAINITFHDVENQEIYTLLKRRVQQQLSTHKTNFDISSEVIFELLDSPNRDDFLKLLDFVEEFKAFGVSFTIDKFGLGFSNMPTIVSMAPKYIKIDASLIKNIDKDKHTHLLVKAIVQFAKELGIKTIAEHVLSQEIFDVCKALEIDEYQGYYFSEAVEYIGAQEC